MVILTAAKDDRENLGVTGKAQDDSLAMEAVA
jgi:hypothetical protein